MPPIKTRVKVLDFDFRKLPCNFMPMTIKTNRAQNFIIAAMALVIIFLLLKSCHNTPQLADKPVVPVKELKEIVRVDSIASRAYVDSVQKLIDFYESKANTAEFDLGNAQADNQQM